MNSSSRVYIPIVAVTLVVAVGSGAAEPTANSDANAIAAKAGVAAPMVLVLRDAAVRRELRLTPSQAKSLDKLLADVDYPLWYVRDMNDAETQAKRARAWDHLEKNLQTILQTPQRARVDGVLLRSNGWPTVLVPRFADSLELSDEQLSRIRNVLKPVSEEKSSVSTGEPSAAEQRQIKEVLSEPQRRRLAQLMGPPFSAKQLRGRPCLAPAFVEVDQWFNSEPLDRRQLEGKVTAVHFWAFGCINCIRNLPHYKSWDEKYADRGLVVVGIHTPETQAERVIESVSGKVKENGIRYPVAVDGAAKNWNAWATRWWPSVYLVDKRGYVRYWWYGELNWEGAKGEEFMRQKIEELLAEKD